MKRFCIALVVVAFTIGVALSGKLLLEDVELSNGLWWGGCAVVATLLLILEWLGHDDDDDTDSIDDG